ncbi:MAG: aldo/keto reductase, partial [Paludibacter sp.]
ADMITPERINQIKALNDIANQRNQSLAQMALAWLLKDNRVTSVLIGASKPALLLDSIQCLKNIEFSIEELSAIELIIK